MKAIKEMLTAILLIMFVPVLIGLITRGLI